METGDVGAGGGQAYSAEEEARVKMEVEARLRAAIRILVIDNEVETTDRVVTILESAGYEAEIAVDGASGLLLVERFQPHLIILGSITHTVSSTEFVRALRSSASNAAPPSDGFEPGARLSPLSADGHQTPILHLLNRAHLLQQRFQTLSHTPLSEAIITPVDERELLDKVARALLHG